LNPSNNDDQERWDIDPDQPREESRVSRVGNRQLNTAIHRVAITQAHYQQPARDFLQRRRADGDTTTEPLCALKRRLSDVVYRALLADA
jgi:transposase